jgi:predicted enzyme related to lactoylglutathione lyase
MQTRASFFLALTMLLTIMGCAQFQPKQTKMSHPVTYFEIPVTDMERAVRFYTTVFGYTLERQTLDGYEMALFPFADGSPGATGALAKGDVYVPAKTGPIIYFRVNSIDETIRRARTLGATVLYEKKNVGEFGFVAEIEDSEGNRIALNEQN